MKAALWNGFSLAPLLNSGLRASEPFVNSFCHPNFNGTWASITNELGAFTPCFIDIVILGTAHLALLVFAIMRLWQLYRAPNVERMAMKGRAVQYVRIAAAVVCAVIPLMQLSARASLQNFSGKEALAPFEVVTLTLASISWAIAAIAFVWETSVYIGRGSWYLRFAVIYVLVGQLAELRFILLLIHSFDDFFVGLFYTYTACHVLLGILALFFRPNLFPHPRYAHLLSRVQAQERREAAYIPLPGTPVEETVCPEYSVNVLSRATFGWMGPLMSTGYKKPLQDSDVWRLAEPDTSADLSRRFHATWEKERQARKPRLFVALHSTFGRLFWLGAVFKIGNDAAQFVAPAMLSILLTAMQEGQPSWKGYLYASCIFLGQVFGVLCEAQYFQCVMRVGFQVRSAVVAAVFRKSLYLSHKGRSGFSSGRIVNMMSSDSETLQQVCQSLHNLWSAPLRIVVAMCMLYRQLGISSLLGLLVLLLMIPIQAFVVSYNAKLVKNSSQRADKRIQLTNEILSSMDVVKCYAWEESFRANILKIREEELSWLRTSQYIMAVNYFILNIVPVLVTVIGFGGYALLGGNLTASRAFTSMSLFSVLRMPLYTFPQLITQVVSSNVALTRLQELLLAEERKLGSNSPLDPSLPAVEIKGGDYSWDLLAEKPTLLDLHLVVPVGKLVAVVGGTGQGKSSLVNAMLGEMPGSRGGAQAIIRGRVAYVPQVAWIFNASVRDNILFGLPYEEKRYHRAITVSALVTDLESMAGGDLTEIGERGINVSGGQKQRISIARAVYSDADVYIFDDPLSALDAHVAKEVFEKCIRGELREKTLIMVTNQLYFLPNVDTVVLIHEGRVAEQGAYDDLMAHGPLFKELMESAGSMEDADAKPEGAPAGAIAPKDGASSDMNGEGSQPLKKKISIRKSPSVAKGDGKQEEQKKQEVAKQAVALVKAEERETGVVHFGVISRYVMAMGGWGALVVLAGFYVLIEGVRVSSSVWVQVWSAAGTSKGPRHPATYYILIYTAISLTQVVLTFCNQFWLAFSSLKAAKAMHEGMLAAIMRAPMSFFNANPLGRLINRFTKDQGDIDKNLAQFCSIFLSACFQLFSTFCIIGVLDTEALWAIVPLLGAFYFVYVYFQTTIREAKRLDAITRSPVNAQFSEALNGLSTIRAYLAQERMAAMNGKAMDRNIRYTLVNMSANRWTAIRLEFLGGLMILATAIFGVLDSAKANDPSTVAPKIGLILSYALTITVMLNLTLRLASMAENSFNAVERVGGYSDVEPEAPAIIEDHRPAPSWPSAGAVSFDKVVMRYRADLPPVLTGLSAEVKGSEKIGVVGRTGAGKSSLFNSLFRIVEIESGTISIDSEDLSKFGLYDVRSKLMIIPQVPVLFTGSVRFNLDPFHEHPDDEIWEALRRAHLKEVVVRLPAGLDTEVVEGGDNFSVGQRQLLSLSRALLRRSQILVMDEATAAVDVGTDALIQETIRVEFKKCTMLIIAHRLNTIIDTDRILVLDGGKAAEYAPARELLSNSSGIFSGMVASTGAANARYLQKIAMGEVDVKDEVSEAAAEERKKWAKQAAVARWSNATKWALSMTLSTSQRELQSLADSHMEDEDTILDHVKDASLVLQQVLAGERSAEISQALQQAGVPEDRWWRAFLRVVEGLAVMGRSIQHTAGEDGARRLEWTQLALTGQNQEGGDFFEE